MPDVTGRTTAAAETIVGTASGLPRDKRLRQEHQENDANCNFILFSEIGFSTQRLNNGGLYVQNTLPGVNDE